MKKVLLIFPLLSLLVMAGCGNANLSSSISAVSSGKTLDYSNQNLTLVPAGIFNKTDTENLNLARNNLTGAIPAEVRFL